MATLYVQEQGALVQKKDHQIIVTKEGQVLETAPMAKIDQVVLMGRGVQMSMALLVDLIERGIPVTLTNQYGSRHYATLTAGPSRFGDLRMQQMGFVNDPARALELARAIVSAKLTNQLALLRETRWAGAPAAVEQINAALAGAANAATVDVVRGYEGAGAAAYFGVWRVSLPPAWGFNGRTFYPPPDPVNALLSFGYTLMLHDVVMAVQMTGLDPYLGVFHVAETGRPSLALDLMEEFRPLLVDRLILELLGANALTRAQFERPPQRPEAVYLNQAGRKLVVDRYEALLQSKFKLPSGEQTTIRRVLLLQAQAVARVIRGEQERYVGVTG
jgi:CRISPR-associated protein Cas1